MAIQFPGGRTILHPPTNQDHGSAGEVNRLPPDAGTKKTTTVAATKHRAPGTPRPAVPISPFRLADLPVELQEAVSREVQANRNMLQGARTIEALMAANKHMCAIIVNDTKNVSRRELNKKIFDAVHGLPLESLSTCALSTLQLVNPTRRREALNMALSDHHDVHKLGALVEWASRLPALSKAERKALVDFAITFDEPYLEAYIGDMIGSMGSGLHVLDPEQHRDLVDTILKMENDAKSLAILHFGKGLHSLHDDMKKALFNATLLLEDADHSRNAICGLAQQPNALKPSQYTRLAQAALTIEDEEFLTDTLHALGPHLASMHPAEQNSLIEAAFSLTDLDGRARVISELTHSLVKFDNTQYTEVLAQLTSKTAHFTDQYRAGFIYACGAQLKSLPPPTDDRVHHNLVNDALAIPTQAHLSRAIEGLANGLPHLNSRDRDRLVSATLALTAEEHRRDALTGLIKNQECLTEDQHTSLFEAMMEMNDEDKAIGISNLGTAIGSLTLPQRDQLVTVTLAMEDETEKSWAMANLTKAIAHLNDSQRSKLVDAAVTMENEANQAEAIASLGRGNAHLTDSQRDVLVNATSNMNDEETKTQAIEGLASIQGKHRGPLIDCAQTLSIDNHLKALHALTEHMA